MLLQSYSKTLHCSERLVERSNCLLGVTCLDLMFPNRYQAPCALGGVILQARFTEQFLKVF